MDAERKALIIEKLRSVLATKKSIPTMSSEFTRTAAVEIYKQECGALILHHGDELLELLSAHN